MATKKKSTSKKKVKKKVVKKIKKFLGLKKKNKNTPPSSPSSKLGHLTKAIGLNGKELELAPERYYKCISEDKTHMNMVYKEGFNVDKEKWNPNGDCERGGLYFCEPGYVHNWSDYGPNVALVRLFKDQPVYNEPCGSKMKAPYFFIERMENRNDGISKEMRELMEEDGISESFINETHEPMSIEDIMGSDDDGELETYLSNNPKTNKSKLLDQCIDHLSNSCLTYLINGESIKPTKSQIESILDNFDSYTIEDIAEKIVEKLPAKISEEAFEGLFDNVSDKAKFIEKYCPSSLSDNNGTFAEFVSESLCEGSSSNKKAVLKLVEAIL